MTKLIQGNVFAAALMVVAGAAVTACDRNQQAFGVDRDHPRPTERVGKSTDRDPSDVARPAISNALSSIAAARCDREARCENVGASKRYESRVACIDKIKEDKLDDLNSEECKGGIDKKELDECLTEIRNEDCNNPLDTIGRLAACRTSDMCKALSSPKSNY